MPFPQPVTVAHGQAMLLKSLSVLDSRVDPISTTGRSDKEMGDWGKTGLSLHQGRKDLGQHNNSPSAATKVLFSEGQQY